MTSVPLPMQKEQQKKKKQSAQDRAGFILPEARIKKRFLASGLKTPLSKKALIYIIAFVECFLERWLLSSDRLLTEQKKRTLTKRILHMARLQDKEKDLRAILPNDSYLISVNTGARSKLSLPQVPSRNRNPALQALANAAAAVLDPSAIPPVKASKGKRR